MTDFLGQVRTHLISYFGAAGIGSPDAASVTFVGTEPVDVLRFPPGADRVVHYVSLGCSRSPMGDPGQIAVEPLRGPRAEIVLRLRDPGPMTGLARSVAMLAAAPAVDGVVLTPDALIDLSAALWLRQSEPVPFTAVLLGRSDIPDLPLDSPRNPVSFLTATPITATEAAWVRLKGSDAMREAWQTDGVDVLDPNRPAAQPR